MLEIENFMESFKESITKRLDRCEVNFKNLVDTMKSFEVTHRFVWKMEEIQIKMKILSYNIQRIFNF